MADQAGRVFRVRRHALFGRLKDIRRTVGELGLATDVNTPHVERFNGTSPRAESKGRGCVARRARRTRDLSRRHTPLRSSLSLFRDVYDWCRPHGSLPAGVPPAMAAGLATEAWSVLRHLTRPAHDDRLGRQVWGEELEIPRSSALSAKGPRKALPTL